MVKNQVNRFNKPKSLDQFIGQDHLLNKVSGLIYGFIRLNYLPSMILHGPPGTGKTTLARLLAKHFEYDLLDLSATEATLNQLKEIQQDIQKQNSKRRIPLKVVVFIDEFHRFSTKQQDFLLSYIETGFIVFIGATTVNLKTRVRSAIKSRCQIFELYRLKNQDMLQILKQNLHSDNNWRLQENLPELSYTEESLQLIVNYANGDIRSATNLLVLLSTALLNHSEVTADYLKLVMSSLHFQQSNPHHLNHYRKLFDILRGKTFSRSKLKQFGELDNGVCLRDPLFYDLPDGFLFKEYLKEYIQNQPDKTDDDNQIVVSDDSDLESMADGQVSVFYEKIRPVQYLKLQAMIQISKLIDSGESPKVIGSRLILFISLFSLSHTLFTKVVKHVKAMQTLNNPITIIETCIDCILRAPKQELNPSNDFSLYLNQVKMFIQGKQMPVTEPVVDYDTDLINTLRQPPKSENLRYTSNFKVSVYYSDDDYTLGLSN